MSSIMYRSVLPHPTAAPAATQHTPATVSHQMVAADWYAQVEYDHMEQMVTVLYALVIC